MVLVDTSVWISVYRKLRVPEAKVLLALAESNSAAVCGLIVAEFLGGFRKTALRERIEEGIREYPFLETDREASFLAASLAASTGCAAGDSLIAATAIRNGVPILTRDHGFKRLVSNGLRLHEGGR